MGEYPVPSFFYSFCATPVLTMEEEDDADFEDFSFGHPRLVTCVLLNFKLESFV